MIPVEQFRIVPETMPIHDAETFTLRSGHKPIRVNSGKESLAVMWGKQEEQIRRS